MRARDRSQALGEPRARSAARWRSRAARRRSAGARRVPQPHGVLLGRQDHLCARLPRAPRDRLRYRGANNDDDRGTIAAGELPPARLEIAVEALGPRDAGKRKRRPIGGADRRAGARTRTQGGTAEALGHSSCAAACRRPPAARPRPRRRRAAREIARRQRPHIVERRLAPPADRCRASNRNAETRRPECAPCIRAAIRRPARPR